MTSNIGPEDVTPDPSIHNVPAADSGTSTSLGASQIQAIGQFFLTSFIAQVAIALGNVSILGVDPLAFLTTWGTNLESQASTAYDTAMTAQSTATTAQTTATTANTTANTAQSWLNSLIAAIPGASVIGDVGTAITNAWNTATAALTNLINPSRLLQLPVAHISSIQPNVLADPDFTDSTTPGWDGTVTHSTGITGAGSWKVVPNGTDQVMFSDDGGQPIAVDANDEWDVSAYVEWTSVTATGTPLMLGIAQYDAAGTFVSTTNVVAHTCSGSSGFIDLSGTYTVPASGVAFIRVSLEVTAAATAGTGIWWSDCDLHLTGLLNGDLVQGIENTINADLQTVVDAFNQATGNNTTGNALSTVETALGSLATDISNAQTAASNALTQLETLVSNLLNAPATVLGNIEAAMSTDLQAVIDGIANAVDGGSTTGNPSSAVEPSVQNIIASITSSTSVAFDAVGSGGSNVGTTNTLSVSWTHTVGSKAEYVIAAVAIRGSGATTATPRSVSYGAYAMTALGATSTTLGLVELWGLYNPPTGPQTVTASATQGSIFNLVGSSVSYTGWAQSGAAFTATGAEGGSTSMALSNVPSAPGSMVVQAFAGFSGGIYGGATVTGSAYNQTQRYNGSSTNGGSNLAGAFLIIGDAPGASTVSFTGTESADGGWAAVAINLINAT